MGRRTLVANLKDLHTWPNPWNEGLNINWKIRGSYSRFSMNSSAYDGWFVGTSGSPTWRGGDLLAPTLLQFNISTIAHGVVCNAVCANTRSTKAYLCRRSGNNALCNDWQLLISDSVLVPILKIFNIVLLFNHVAHLCICIVTRLGNCRQQISLLGK